jgi:hypothetical protein
VAVAVGRVVFVGAKLVMVIVRTTGAADAHVLLVVSSPPFWVASTIHEPADTGVSLLPLTVQIDGVLET